MQVMTRGQKETAMNKTTEMRINTTCVNMIKPFIPGNSLPGNNFVDQ